MSDKLFGCRAIFSDIDGTLAMGDNVFPGAPEFIQRMRDIGRKVYFLTNNSSRSKADYVKKLAKLTIPAEEEDIIISTDGLIDLLLSKGITRVFCVGTESMKAQMKESGIEHTEGDPQAVAVGYDTELTYAKLRRACALIHTGMDYYVSHPDVVCPSPEGPMPDAGTFIRMIEMTTGRSPRAVLGKPNAGMLSHLVGPVYEPDECAMIGDRLYTDKALADNLGMRFICVLSGETKKKDLEALKKEELPAIIVDSVADL